MQTVTNPSLMSLLSKSDELAEIRSLRIQATVTQSEATPAGSGKDQLAIAASAGVITVLAGLCVALWMCPLAQTIAEWAGASWLQSASIGVDAVLLSLSVVPVLCWMVLRRFFGINRSR